jgi:hypothetical protein
VVRMPKRGHFCEFSNNSTLSLVGRPCANLTGPTLVGERPRIVSEAPRACRTALMQEQGCAVFRSAWIDAT